MSDTRTKKSVLSIFSGWGSEIFSKILAFISRTIFINVLGAEYLGINGLFTNILTILSLAELGVGSAITFYMYKPIADKNTEKIKSLMQFYKRCYTIIGFVILFLGIAGLPILPYIVNLEKNTTDINLNIIYFLFILNSVISYLFFAYKSTIIFANQKQYIINIYAVIFSIVSCICESVVIIIFKDFILSLVVKIGIGIIKNLFIAIKADKLYPYLKEKNVKKLSINEIKEILKDIYSIFLVKLGSVLATATDNIIISKIFKTALVGLYSNYTMIITVLNSLIGQVTVSIRAAVGNIIASESKEAQFNHFKNLDFINYCITSITSICLFQLFNQFITIWIGEKYLLPTTATLCIVIHFYLARLLEIVFIFREGMGLFKYGKFSTLVGGVVNIFLSIILSKFIGITGVFLGTVIVDLFFSTYTFVNSLFKYGFEVKSSFQFIRILKYFFITIITSLLLSVITVKLNKNSIVFFIIRGIICFLVSVIIIIIFYFRSSEFNYVKNKICSIIRKSI
ncbi:MAG: lipopolysaccharide biosynthesis protein [Clostridium sp.]